MLPKLEFGNVPLELVIQFMREVSGVSIYVNWGALQAAGIDKSSPVSVNLRNVTFEKGLKTVLEGLEL